MPDDFPAEPAPQSLAADFAARVALRDVLAPPVPLSQTPEAIAGRVDDWLRSRHGMRDVRSRTALTQMLLLLLARPEASTAALHTAAGQGPRSGARATLRLHGWGLTTWQNRARTRYHRLTRAAEDALLAVVTGQAADGRPW